MAKRLLLRLDRVDDGMAWESADVECIERFPKIEFAACIFPSADPNVQEYPTLYRGAYVGIGST